jgi:hypothetical protein
MPDEEMIRLVKDTDLSVPNLNHWKAESLLNSNPIAEWLDANCIFEPEAKTYVGRAEIVRHTEGHDQGESFLSWNEYRNAESWLYANYVEFCAATGSKAISIRRFSDLLLDLCRDQLKVTEIFKARDERGAYFQGLRMRVAGETSPRPVTGGAVDPIADSPPTTEPETMEVSNPAEPDESATERNRTDHQWAGLLETAKGDDQVKALYSRLAGIYPHRKHPFKQQVWDLLSRDRKFLIQSLLRGQQRE